MSTLSRDSGLSIVCPLAKLTLGSPPIFSDDFNLDITGNALPTNLC